MIGPDSPNPLIAERQPLFQYVGCSVLFHIGVLASAWAGGLVLPILYSAMLFIPFCQPEPPKESIEIEVFAALPKSRLNVPDRQAVAPRISGEKSPVQEPPPVKQSDLVIHKEEPKNDGNAEEVRRQALLDAIERNRILEQVLDGPEGPIDRVQTDPNGVEGLENAVLGASARGDPEYARWMAKVQQLLMSRFHPLTQGRTDLKCKMALSIDKGSGQILSWKIIAPSGDQSFDASAESVVSSIGAIPLPPEKYIPLLEEAVNVTFVPPT